MFFPYFPFSFYSHSPTHSNPSHPAYVRFPLTFLHLQRIKPQVLILRSLIHNSLLTNLLPSLVLSAFPWLTITQMTILSTAVIQRWTQNVSIVLFLLTTPRCSTHIYTKIGEKYFFSMNKMGTLISVS